jgi:hypothetical protein
MATYRNRHTGQIKQSIFPMGYPWEKVVVTPASQARPVAPVRYAPRTTVVEEVYVEPGYGYGGGFIEDMIIADAVIDAVDMVADTFADFGGGISDTFDSFSGGGDFGGGADFDW